MIKPDSVVIHLTSNHTWIGLADNIWPQVKPLTESIDFKKEYTHIYTKVKTKKFNKEPRDTMNCLTNLYFLGFYWIHWRKSGHVFWIFIFSFIIFLSEPNHETFSIKITANEDFSSTLELVACATLLSN